jgi:hypothetical protein
MNGQNKFLLLPSADTGFSNYDVVNTPRKASKPKSGLAYAVSWNENPADGRKGQNLH